MLLNILESKFETMSRKSSFVDLVKIRVKAGKGGDGIIHFRREKYVPRGGPDGGDGGNGGNVYLIGEKSLKTLLDFKYKRIFRAEDGKDGGPSRRTGRKGKSVFIKVPLGTVVRDEITGEYLGEVIEHGQKLLVARGGRGGKGNARFATPTLRAPRIREKGEEGEEKFLILELKLIADVGLVGYPNAGKTTLLKALSGSSGKIAPYPFTTLTPNLGMVKDEYETVFAVVDIPGIIEGAHEGRGLGLQFLRHTERTKILLFVIDVTSPNPLGDFQSLLEEIKLYNKKILEKPIIVALNKIDLVDANDLDFNIKDVEVYKISALKGTGIEELKGGIKKWLKDHQ